jgi:general secretion pathway protein N
MSMRALTLIALLVIANGEALAVNAPSAVEPRGAEPQEDLFATRPAPDTPPPSQVAPQPRPAAATEPAAPPATGNPLWGKPLNRLTATRERPLFAPTRRPPAVAALVQPVVAPPPPPKPAEPEKPQLSLLGTVAGSREKIGLFVDSTTKSVVRLKTGEIHKGWTLRDVNPREVELARGLDTAVLSMPSPEMKAGGAPPPLAMPAMPAASGNPAPLQTSLAGPPPLAGPMGSSPSGATIVVQQPAYQPPPAATNPFLQAGPFPKRMQ